MAANTEMCHITTIEKYEKRIPVAKENFQKSGMGHRITLLEGDALAIMRELTGTYDMIFMDAAKGQYIHFLPDALRLLRTGGILISDNVLQDGDIIESHYAVERRNRTIYRRMREYLYVLKHTDGLLTSIVPVGDGAAVSSEAEGSDSVAESVRKSAADRTPAAGICGKTAQRKTAVRL